MLAALWTPFWPSRPVAKADTARPKPRPSPLFIGDAMQPWNGETLLLDILRRDAERADDQSRE